MLTIYAGETGREFYQAKDKVSYMGISEFKGKGQSDIRKEIHSWRQTLMVLYTGGT
jgi:hypothetical protein